MSEVEDGSYRMIMTEPPSVFLHRLEQLQIQKEIERQKFWKDVEFPTEHPDGWDHVIMDFFVRKPGEMILYMTAVNILAKQSRARSKRDRERAKLIIMRSIGRLIRVGRLRRVRRRFVRVNEVEISHNPLTPFRVERHVTGPGQSRHPVGSTPGQVVVHPGVFV